ncbi:MAG: hypothetical protein ABIT09_06580 [Croceibacterium sp.]
MDTLRGQFDSLANDGDYDASEDDLPRDTPPVSIGTDERRMQVRAYNHWATLLTDRNFPAIEDLDPDSLPDFGPFSVLLDFTNGIDNPGISYLGVELAEECGVPADGTSRLENVPSRSLLTRITDHYMQILANQAPIGFEAEFVNQRGKTILYRGILLPFSSDDESIDFIYGVINWKELADQAAADELLLEIDQALEAKPPRAPLLDTHEPLTDWADGPGSIPANDAGVGLPGDAGTALPGPAFGLSSDEPLELAHEAPDGLEVAFGGMPDHDNDEFDEDFAEEDDESTPFASLMPTEPLLGSLIRKKPIVLEDSMFDDSLVADFMPEPGYRPIAIAMPVYDPADMRLADWLAAARETAVTASTSEDRTRGALYEAIGRAYDFSLAAAGEQDEFAALLADSGLTVQERAPMTPVVKLVFGADYDKTRLTEYAAALSHAYRLALPQGALGHFLAAADGGLKGVVKAERRLRRENNGRLAGDHDTRRDALVRKLRAAPPLEMADIPVHGQEFALVMIRRTDTGAVIVLGEVPDDAALVERAARKLLG